MWGQKEREQDQNNAAPPSPYADGQERQDDLSSPTVEDVKEEEKKTPKEKTEQPRGRRTITAEEWEEKSSALTVVAEKYLSAMTVDSVIRKHRAMVTQLRDRGMTDADIAEMFGSVYGLDVDSRDIARAMKPKRKRTRKTKETDTETPAENIMKDTAEEAAM